MEVECRVVVLSLNKVSDKKRIGYKLGMGCREVMGGRWSVVGGIGDVAVLG